MKKSEELRCLDRYDINDLCDIMTLLRSENGCPWDREQTHKSIRKDFIEETYEAVEAIDRDDPHLLREELGDVLLQLVFHSEIERESGNFSFDDVINDICVKLIYRHPHVFGNVTVENSGEVLDNWDKLKKEEKKEERATVTDELRAVPASLPALMRAQKVGKRAGKVGFDFRDALQAMDKVREEVDEVSEELERLSLDKERISEEIGDLLLAVTNVARFTGVDCEEALGKATEKFISRFEGVESATEKCGKCIKNMSETELLSYWEAEKIKKS
ncbi:MAG: nucleoside triphosphate pyrophosphohydrolase [Ruminococcaceae bacterium]|nr:nucleoside triphosphate pyrophosphohydrolase [Oscillospiraceae bacterium]